MFTLGTACNRAHIYRKLFLCMVECSFRMMYSLICNYHVSSAGQIYCLIYF